MSKVTDQIVDDIENDMYDDDISDEDYGFIFGPDGELKSVFLPESADFEVPAKIQELLELFGINDVSEIGGSRTLH